MNLTRQLRRKQERDRKKETNKLIKKLQISDFNYVADDKNLTLSAMGPQIVDFFNVIGLQKILKEHVHIEKRKSLFSPDKLSELLILQNILGYDRIENSRALNLDGIIKDKIQINNYPDPETFRDELGRYVEENIEHLFFVNQAVLDILCRLTEPQYVDLYYDSKVITVYGDQQNAAVGHNPGKHGRKSYHLKICTIEPFGFILAFRLDPGNTVSTTGFIDFHNKCIAAMPQNHLVVQTVRMDSGYFSEGNIQALEGDFLFFEVVAKKYRNIKHWITECIPEEDFEPIDSAETIYGAAFSFCLNSWQKPYDFVVIKRLNGYDDNGQGLLFPKWRYQVICHNHPDMSPKQVWEDYNKRAKIELTVRDLDYDHFITKVPTGDFLSNFAYFWHCVLSYNLMLIFKKFVLPIDWSKCRLSTLRKKLINIPGRLVNRSGKMVMRLIASFPHMAVLSFVKEQLLRLYWKLNPVPV